MEVVMGYPIRFECISAELRTGTSSKTGNAYSFPDVQGICVMGSEKAVGKVDWPRGAELPQPGGIYELEFGFDSYQGRVGLRPKAVKLLTPAKSVSPSVPSAAVKV